MGQKHQETLCGVRQKRILTKLLVQATALRIHPAKSRAHPMCKAVMTLNPVGAPPPDPVVVVLHALQQTRQLSAVKKTAENRASRQK